MITDIHKEVLGKMGDELRTGSDLFGIGLNVEILKFLRQNGYVKMEKAFGIPLYKITQSGKDALKDALKEGV